MSSNKYDLIIIGAGPAGLTTAIYAMRANLKTLIIEKDTPGGAMVKTSAISNYPGFKSIDGATLSYNMYEQVLALQTPFAYGDVTSVVKENDEFIVTVDNQKYISFNVVVASGTAYRSIGLKEEAKFVGNGISYCAVCDGKLFSNKDIMVIGGGDSALKECLYLSSFASKVYLLHRRNEFRGFPSLVESVKKNSKIEIKTPYVIEKINGDSKIESIDAKNVNTNEIKNFKVEGLFPFLGSLPSTSFMSSFNVVDKMGYMIVDENMESSVSGLYGVGDVRVKELRQVITACNDGAIAAQHIADLKNR